MAHHKKHKLAVLCRVPSVYVSGFDVWKCDRTRERTGATNAPMVAIIRMVQRKLTHTYGRPRITKKSEARRFPASMERVERLVSENDTKAKP